MVSCDLPRPAVQTGDVPHPQVSDLRRQLTVNLDDCNIFIIAQAMNEFDRKKQYTMRFESWPDEVRGIFDREIAAWEKRNAGFVIRAYTISTAEQTFTIALHWKVK